MTAFEAVMCVAIIGIVPVSCVAGLILSQKYDNFMEKNLRKQMRKQTQREQNKQKGLSGLARAARSIMGK